MPAGQAATDWRAWIQLLLALVPIVGAVTVAGIFAADQSKLVDETRSELEPIQLGWEFHQVSSAVSTSLTSIEAAARPDASPGVLLRAEADREAASMMLTVAAQRTTELAESIAIQTNTDVDGFRTVLEQTFGSTAAAFESQEIGLAPNPQLQMMVGVIESRFTGGGSVGTSGWDTETNFLVNLYQALTVYQSAWLIEQRELVRAATSENAAAELEVVLEDGKLSASRQDAWDEIRVLTLAVSTLESYELPVINTDTAGVDDPAELLLAALRDLSSAELSGPRGSSLIDDLVLDGLAISDRATGDIGFSQVSLATAAQTREARQRQQQLQYVGIAALLVFLGTALLVMTRSEIRRRQRIEEAHRSALDRLDAKASRDPMTGVWNRRRLDERVDELLAERADGASLVVAYIDLDRFKAINDVWGHTTGDAVLQIAAKRLADLKLDGEAIEVVRSGGDEFVCYAPLYDDDPELIADFGARLIAAVSQPMSIGGRVHSLGATAGLSVADEHATRESLMFEADSSLLLAKRHQRGTAAVYNRSLSRSAELVKALPDALVDGQIKCWYQPAYDVKTGRISHAEALARWTRPDGSMVSPVEFIPLVESFSMASQLTELALSNATREQSRSNGCRVWINVSPGELDVSDFADRFIEALGRLGGDPKLLGVEITETAAVSDPLNFARQLTTLRAVGVATAIDDFGNGYSPLGYLQDLPIDVVKLDRSLIDGIDTSAPNQHIVRGLLALCRELGIETVAEGVERFEEYDWVVRHGIDHVQGYLTARPMPSAELDWSAQVTDELMVGSAEPLSIRP